jgi:hypothetical protein
MNSLFYVSSVSVHGPGICCRTVSIGGPGATNNPDDDVAKFCGKHVVVVNDKGKGILSAREDAEVSIHKSKGEAVVFGAYTSVDNGSKTLYVHNGETCASLITGEMVVPVSVLLTADDKQGTISVLNGDFHTVPGEGTSLNGNRIELNHHDYPMGIVVSGGKAKGDAETKGDAKAKLDIDENEDTVSLSGGVIVFEHGKASISVTDGDGRVDMPNGYTSLSGSFAVLKCGDQAEIFLANAWVGINHAGSKVDLRSDSANFKIGKKDRFVPAVKDAHIDCSTGSIYCNGKEICRTPLMKELGRLFKADPKPASVPIS